MIFRQSSERSGKLTGYPCLKRRKFSLFPSLVSFHRFLWTIQFFYSHILSDSGFFLFLKRGKYWLARARTSPCAFLTFLLGRVTKVGQSNIDQQGGHMFWFLLRRHHLYGPIAPEVEKYCWRNNFVLRRSGLHSRTLCHPVGSDLLISKCTFQ